MKQLCIHTFFLFFLWVAAKGQGQNKAIEYNNYIVREQSKLISNGLEYMSFSVHSEDYNSIEKKRLELINDIHTSLRKIHRMPSFNGSNRLKNITLDVFYMYLEVYETDLLELMGLRKKYQNDYSALEAYLQEEAKIDIKLNKAIEKLSKAQEDFAKKNKLKVEGSDASEQNYEVLQISRLSTYTRLVFLEYFEVSWKFNDMVAVLHLRDGKVLDKKRKAVMEASQEALLNLKEMNRFNNEKDYIGQTMDIIEYFNSLSANEFGRVARLFAKESLTNREAEFINQVFRDYNANIEVMVYNWNMANQNLWRSYVAQPGE